MYTRLKHLLGETERARMLDLFHNVPSWEERTSVELTLEEYTHLCGIGKDRVPKVRPRARTALSSSGGRASMAANGRRYHSEYRGREQESALPTTSL